MEPTVDSVKWCYYAGMEVCDIASAYKVSADRVRAMLIGAGVDFRLGRPRKNRPRTIKEARAVILGVAP